MTSRSPARGPASLGVRGPRGPWHGAIVLVACLALLHPAAAADDPATLRATANRLAEAGEYAKALPYFHRVVRLLPRDAEVRVERGFCLLALGHAADAGTDFEAALALAPKLPPAFYGRGLLRQVRGDLAGALADADTAVALEPTSASFVALRADVRRARGDARGALADYRKAAALAPDRTEFVRMIEAVEEELRSRGGAPLDPPPGGTLPPDGRLPPPAKSPPAQPPPTKAPIEPPRRPPVEPAAPSPKPTPPPQPTPKEGGATVLDVPDAVRMKAPDDLLDEAAEPKGDVLWTTSAAIAAATGAAEPSIEIPGRLRWEAFDAVAYAAAVTAAKEGLRLLQGPMSPAQHAQYEKKWLPYYGMPTPEVLAYFNQLMPVLERFLAARAGFTAASQAFARTLAEAGMLEAAGQPDAQEDALFVARAQRRAMESYRAALDAAGKELEALGNPPNPYAAHRRRRKAYDEALASLDPNGPLVWVLRETTVTEPPCGSDEHVTRTRRHQDGFLAFTSSWKAPYGGGRQAAWIAWRVPRVVAFADGRADPKPGTAGFRAAVPVELGGTWVERLDPTATREALFGFSPNPFHFFSAQVGYARTFGGVGRGTWATCDAARGHGRFGPPDARVGAPTSFTARTQGIVEVVRRVEAGPKDEKEALAARLAMGLRSMNGPRKAKIAVGETWRAGDWTYLGEGQYDLDLAIEASVYGCSVVYVYRYDLVRPDDPRVEEAIVEGERDARVAEAEAEAFRREHAADAPLQRAFVEEDGKQGATATPPAGPPRTEKTPAQLAAEQAKRAAIEFQEGSVRYFEENLRRDREEYARTTDPGARKDLELRMLAADANLHAAKDHLTYLKTGEWVRTRTAYDAYNHERMLAIGREEAARLVEPDRLLAGIGKQIDLLPPAERAAMRDDVRRALGGSGAAWRDPARLREVLSDVGSRVRDRWSKEAGDELRKAKVYRGVEFALEGTKLAAGIVLLGAGGYGVAAWGGSATALWATESLLGAAYGGAIGYVEGGVVEASRQSLQWAGLLGFVASEAIEGYRDTGTVQGAGDRAGKAYLLGKALEFGVRWTAGVIGRWRAAPPEVAALREQMAHGEQLVRAAAQSEWAVAEALSRGAPTATVEALTRDATRAAAAVQASWPAKIFLKRQGVTVSSAAVGERVEQIVRVCLDDVTEALRRMGYGEAELLRFRQVRNASSAGTFGMDFDLGLVESPGMTITRNGQRVSLSTLHDDAQRAMNDAWHARTGFTAEESFINMTTTNHREAFARAMLANDIPFECLTPRDIERAADVLRTKVATVELQGMQRSLEQCRTLAKEMGTKMLPYLERRIAMARAAGDAALLSRLEHVRGTWQGIYGQVERIGKRETDPSVLWRLLRDLEASTGGKTVEAIANDLANSWDIMAKFGR